MVANPLKGSWRLRSCTARRTDGKVVEPYGAHPKGTLTYDDAGRVTTVIVHGDLERFETDSIVAATRSEASNAFRRTLAYFGTYDLDEDGETITHHIDGCTFPNWMGHDEVRRYEVSDDRLVLSTPPYQSGGGEDAVFTLVWERAD